MTNNISKYLLKYSLFSHILFYTDSLCTLVIRAKKVIKLMVKLIKINESIIFFLFSVRQSDLTKSLILSIIRNIKMMLTWPVWIFNQSLGIWYLVIIGRVLLWWSQKKGWVHQRPCSRAPSLPWKGISLGVFCEA